MNIALRKIKNKIIKDNHTLCETNKTNKTYN